MRIGQISGAVHVHAVAQHVASVGGRLFDGPILGHIMIGTGSHHLIATARSVDEQVDFLERLDFSRVSCALAFPRGFGLSQTLASPGLHGEELDDIRRLAKWLEWAVYEVR